MIDRSRGELLWQHLICDYLLLIHSLLLLVYLIIYSVTCLWRYLSSLYSPFAPLSRPGKFAETIVIVTTSLQLNENGGNNNLFPQHFSSNVIVPEAFLGGKGENLSAKSNRFFSETWTTVRHRPSVQSALSFCFSHFLLLQADCSIAVAHMSHSTTWCYSFILAFSSTSPWNALSNTTAYVYSSVFKCS